MVERDAAARRQPDEGNGGTRVARPTAAQRRYLERGLVQAGGKLPLFDRDGQEIDPRTIKSCIDQGWAEPWFANPIKPDWLVCKISDQGRKMVEKKT